MLFSLYSDKQRHQGDKGYINNNLKFCSKCQFKSCTVDSLVTHALEVHNGDSDVRKGLVQGQKDQLRKSPPSKGPGPNNLMIRPGSESRLQKLLGGAPIEIPLKNKAKPLSKVTYHPQYHMPNKGNNGQTVAHGQVQTNGPAQTHHQKGNEATKNCLGCPFKTDEIELIINHWNKFPTHKEPKICRESDKNLKCDHCDAMFANEQEKKSHILKKGAGKFLCPRCQYKSCTEDHLQEHLKKFPIHRGLAGQIHRTGKNFIVDFRTGNM